MLDQDPPHLGDRPRVMMHLRVGRGHADLAHRALRVRALDRHDTVVANADKPGVAVADDAVHRHPARWPETIDRLEHHGAGLEQVDARRRRPFILPLEASRVESDGLIVDRLRLGRSAHGERGQAPESERGQHRSLVRRGDAHDAVDEGQRFEEVGAGDLPPQLGPQSDLFERHAAHRLPDLVPRRDNLQLRVQAPHAVPDEHQVSHRGIRALGITLPNRCGELLPQFGRRLQKGGTGGIVEDPRLITPVKLRPGP